MRWMSREQHRICSRRDEEERGDGHPSGHGDACRLPALHADRLFPTVHHGTIWHPHRRRNPPHPSEVLQDPRRIGLLEVAHVAGADPADACYRGDPPGIRLDWIVKTIVPGTMVFTIYEREETGRMMENVLPVPTSLVTATRPCIASTALRTIARPRPLPPDSRLRLGSMRVKRSQMCGSASGGIPGPWSVTAMVTVPPVRWAVMATVVPSGA